MQTFNFDNRSFKEKLFFDMINLVKIFSILVVVLSIILVTIQVCETAKRDFKLKNIFRFMDDKRLKKTKKEIKQLKDFKVHYMETKNKEKLIPSETRHIHTLMPLPLPVHLPFPSPPREHLVENHSLPPSAPATHTFPLFHPEHLSFHPDSHLHNPYLTYLHQSQHHLHQIPDSNRPLLAEESSSFIRPMPPSIIIHREFNPMPFQVDVHDHIEERVAYPVFEFLGDNPLESARNIGIHPNAHSYGDNDETIRTDLDNDFRSNRNKHINDNKQRISKENKTIETTARLVNNKKFNTIHNRNTKFDKFYDEESSHSQKFVKSNENSRDSDERLSNKEKDRKEENDLRPFNNRVDQKIYRSEPLPDEHVINIVEDEWTFKDLDLWLIR